MFCDWSLRYILAIAMIYIYIYIYMLNLLLVCHKYYFHWKNQIYLTTKSLNYITSYWIKVTKANLGYAAARGWYLNIKDRKKRKEQINWENWKCSFHWKSLIGRKPFKKYIYFPIKIYVPVHHPLSFWVELTSCLA